MISDEKFVGNHPRGPAGKPKEGLPKKERLVKTGEFSRVYKSGRSVSSGPFILKISPNDLKLNRIGFSISSRSIKKAHQRNRVKRLFRETFRKNKKALKQGFDAVLIVRKEPPAKFAYKDSEKILLELAKKAGVLA